MEKTVANLNLLINQDGNIFTAQVIDMYTDRVVGFNQDTEINWAVSDAVRQALSPGGRAGDCPVCDSNPCKETCLI